MIQRYCKGIYTKDYKKTIGVDFLERQIEYDFNFAKFLLLRNGLKRIICFLFINNFLHRIDGEDIRIMLWDTAGMMAS